MTIPITGLPEGVEAYRFGYATNDEFEIIQEAGAVKITKGPRVGSKTQVIVRPAAGWAFRFDARQYCYVPVKLLAAPVTVTAMVKFQATDSSEQDAIQSALAALKEVPGFKELISS